MSAALAQLDMQERTAPSRPSRLGTRRRAPKAGASRSAERRAPSLDTDKYLQTSCREWLESTLSEGEVYRRQFALHGQLLGTYHKLWQDHAADARRNEVDGLEKQAEWHGKQAIKWEKRWLRVYNCRNEWVGYRADCCKGETRPLAVPAGCNDRLCPLCAWDRSRIARKRIKTMFSRLTHPALITLTVPNIPNVATLNPTTGAMEDAISKHTFNFFREQIRKFLAQQKGWIAGGVYAIETTYNRAEKSWHIHTHILADLSAPLPEKADRVDLAGRRVMAFRALKWRLEFDWMRIVTGGWGKSKRKSKDPMVRAGDEFIFSEWIRELRNNELKQRTPNGYRPISGLSASEIERRTEWNRANRRIVDVRPVTDREKVAYEVLKYITKVSDFGDLPEAVEPFANAVKGARLIQTFGSWYGVKLDTPPEESERFSQYQCACGDNHWKRIGVFYRRDVEMDEQGRFWLTLIHDWNSAGTVPRPTIRALDVREE